MKWDQFHGRSGNLKINNIETNSFISYTVEVTDMPVTLSGDISFNKTNSDKTRIMWKA